MSVVLFLFSLLSDLRAIKFEATGISHLSVRLNSKNNAVWPPITMDSHAGGMNLVNFRNYECTDGCKTRQTNHDKPVIHQLVDRLDY